jgi:hypothetical protein
VHIPESIQQVFIRDHGGIENNLDGLGMACFVGADILVRWIIEMPAGLADSGRNNAF